MARKDGGRLKMSVEQRTGYGFGVKVKLSYDEAMDRTKAALKEQGFGILTEIDVRKTMKEKLDVDFRKYTILGACNPPLAHAALSAEIDIGLLLPCNVVVYEVEGGTIVEAMDPGAALGAVKNPALDSVAAEADGRLRKALERVAS